jgi:hypothetical protein
MTVRLAATQYGKADEAGAPPLAILARGVGSARNWPRPPGVSPGTLVIAFDLRNHAPPLAGGMQSRWPKTCSRCWTSGDTAVPRCSAAAWAAAGQGSGAARPDTVERLVVVDIAPVPYRLHHLGLVQAMRGLISPGLSDVAKPMPGLRLPSPMPQREGPTAEPGVRKRPARWRLNLEVIERRCRS